MIQSIPEVAKKAFVSKCLNMTLSSLSQKSPSQTTLQWSPVSPTPTDQRISQKVNCKHIKCKTQYYHFLQKQKPPGLQRVGRRKGENGAIFSW